jgi:phosphatidylglycerol:prolipoprotein diacylglycerol transferase
MIGTYLFHIGNFGVPSMGLCILVGTVLAVFLSWLLRKESSLDWNGEFVDSVIWGVLLGFVGMKILYWIVTPDEFLSAIREGRILDLLTTGMVFYGGLIGGILGVFICSRRKKKNFFEFTDLFAPCFCVAHAFGRIGCLLVGCCAGVEPGESVLFGAATYNGACAFTYANGHQHLPVPLMEAIFLILLCVVLIVILKKAKHLGTVTGWYLVLYAIWRFVIESFRGDAERGIYGLFSTSQWISFAILIAGVVILVTAKKRPRPENFREFREEELTVPEAEQAPKEPEAPEETPEAPEETPEAPEETPEAPEGDAEE